MVFSTPVFLFLFFPIILMLYYFCRQDFRNSILLISSLFFYFWGEPKYFFLILTLTLVNYIFGLLLGKPFTILQKRMIIICSVVVDFGSLLYFKYFNFFVENISFVLGTKITNSKVILPLGISFFIFQIMSYVIDVYWGNVKPQKKIQSLALYITLFPQLIAGPIVRYIDVEQQINNRKHTVEKFAEGCRRFCIGFSKKILIADQMSVIADFTFNNYSRDAFTAWLGVIAYTLQIYYDFSGYSDMAIGIGKMFGFDFLENFNFPYISRSIKEFWRRWHMSLSSWFKDYVYIPLGGSKCGVMRSYINLIVVFLFTGFWHGASWNFIVWGLWYVIFLVLERAGLESFLKKLPAIATNVYSLLIIVTGWVFFRADTLGKAVEYLKVMYSFHLEHNTKLFLLLDSEKIFFFIVGVVFSLPVIDIVKNKYNKQCVEYILDISVLFCFSIAVLYMCGSGFSPFLYFRF